MRSPDSTVDVARTCPGHQRPALAGCWIDAFEARLAIFETAVDQLLEALHPIT
jgi:hypothetical protein